jgi:putative NADH-flavin reductase
MKLVLFGATGHVGHAILEEALARGHEVTAVVRDADRLTERDDKLHVVVGDIVDAASWLPSAKGVAAVIASVSARRSGHSETISNAVTTLLDNLPGAGVRRRRQSGNRARRKGDR